MSQRQQTHSNDIVLIHAGIVACCLLSAAGGKGGGHRPWRWRAGPGLFGHLVWLFTCPQST
jgi:hypothetical protein